MSQPTRLEHAATTAHDMTVADVRETITALRHAFETAMAAATPAVTARRGIPQDIPGWLAEASRELTKATKRHLRARLPATEYQITATGRRLRALTADWGEWMHDWAAALTAVLSCCDTVLDGTSTRIPGLYDALEAAQTCKRRTASRAAAGAEADARVATPPYLNPARLPKSPGSATT